MEDFDFGLIKYKRPRVKPGARTLTNIIGIDSEAYADGRPFMFPTSTGRVIDPREWPKVLQGREFRSANFVVWNLRYDSGAFLYHLPTRALEALRLVGEVEHAGWRYRYFPHKFLRISRGRNRATFWDLMPFYECSLEKAARDHLGEGKMDLPTKRFTPEYVKSHWEDLVLYGVRDAQLTQRLALRLIEGLEAFGMQVSSLYSQASISQRYFTQEAGLVDVWRPWQSRRLVLKYATDAYWGGKFEVTKRGRFEGRQYDIKSAYPYEMSRLLDIREAKFTRSKVRPDSAQYGFIRARLKLSPRLHHSVPQRISNVSVFPCGEFEATLTLAEYEDLVRVGAGVEVEDAFWLTMRQERYPYVKVIAHLWQMKEGAGAADPWIRKLAKKLLNSFYGKLIQLTPEVEGAARAGAAALVRKGDPLPKDLPKVLRAGPCWNPIYGAVITANTRLRVTQMQRDLGESCLGVHTDSVLTTGTLPKGILGKDLGDWSLEREGEGVVIACGVYDLGEKVAFRGLKVRDGTTWRERLAADPTARAVKVPVTLVPSLLGSVARGKREEANVFRDEVKRVDLNADRKRIWPRDVSARDLLRGLQGSAAPVIIR